LITEYCSGGEIFTLRLQQPKNRFPFSVVRLWAAQLVSAIQLLHRTGIVHRDLKLENLLLDSKLHVRLSDFGLCKNLEVWSAITESAMVPHLQSFNSPSVDINSIPSKDIRTPDSSMTDGATMNRKRPSEMTRSYSFCGTSEYISPEMIVSAVRPGQIYSYEV
jgi:protein-serine/threonine kinase